VVDNFSVEDERMAWLVFEAFVTGIGGSCCLACFERVCNMNISRKMGR